MIFERRYVFQGHAVGASAQFRRFEKGQIVVDTCFEGSAALPVTGGCTRSESAGRTITHNDQLLLSFESAMASVTGDFTDLRAAMLQTDQQNPHRRIPTRTVCVATVKRVNLQNRITIDSLASEFQCDDPRNGGQPHFSVPELPTFENIQVDHYPLNVSVDETFFHLSTLQAIEDEYRNSEAFRKTYGSRFYHSGADASGCAKNEVSKVKGFVVVSVVRKLAFPSGLPPGASVAGNVLTLPNFGKAYFGEMIVGPDTRRLTLLRLQMGSVVGGEGSFNETKPNGQDMP